MLGESQSLFKEAWKGLLRPEKVVCIDLADLLQVFQYPVFVQNTSLPLAWFSIYITVIAET